MEIEFEMNFASQCDSLLIGIHLGGRGRPPLHRRRGIYEEGVELSLTAAAHSTYNPRGENHLWSLSMILGGRC